jgi:hypothetical protein
MLETYFGYEEEESEIVPDRWPVSEAISSMASVVPVRADKALHGLTFNSFIVEFKSYELTKNWLSAARCFLTSPHLIFPTQTSPMFEEF